MRCQKFLHQNKRINVLHEFHIDHKCARDQFGLKLGNFGTLQKFLPNARNFCVRIYTSSSLTCNAITNFAYSAYFLRNLSFNTTRPSKCPFRKIQDLRNNEAVKMLVFYSTIAKCSNFFDYF